MRKEDLKHLLDHLDDSLEDREYDVSINEQREHAKFSEPEESSFKFDEAAAWTKVQKKINPQPASISISESLADTTNRLLNWFLPQSPIVQWAMASVLLVVVSWGVITLIAGTNVQDKQVIAEVPPSDLTPPNANANGSDETSGAIDTQPDESVSNDADALYHDDELVPDLLSDTEADAFREVMLAEAIIENFSGLALEPYSDVKFRGPEGARLPQRSLVFGEESIPFNTDSHRIREDARKQLDEIGKALQSAQLSNMVFEIAGHTDIRGEAPYNQDLSERRALSVSRYLSNYYGVDDSRLKPEGYGEYRVRNIGTEAYDHAQNRRVEIGVLGTLENTHEIANEQLALDVNFLYEKDERKATMYEGMTLTSRDNYQIFFKPSQQCYVYIYQHDSGDNITQLFPNTQFSPMANPIRAGNEYWIPGKDEFFYLDDVKGAERIYVLVTKTPASNIEEFFARIENSFSQVEVSARESFIEEIENHNVQNMRVFSQSEVASRNLDNLPAERLTVGEDLVLVFTFDHQ